MIKKLFKVDDIQLKVLIVVSVLMVYSMFATILSKNTKVFATGFALWVMTVFWNVLTMLKKNNMSGKTIISALDDKCTESRISKEHGKLTLYFATIPMMAIGLVFVVIGTICMFTF